MNELEQKIIDKLQGLFQGESSGHDITHLERTYNIAKHIQQIEGGDKEVILLSSLLHDMHRLIQKETGKFCSPKDSLQDVTKILNEVNAPQDKLDQILHSIEHHEEYNFSKDGKTVSDIETLILQDADNLDAMGAIGIARTFSYSGANGVPIWNKDDQFTREHYDESSAEDPTTIHHFYSKLLKLKNNMNTTTGKQMAEKRHDYMVAFLDHFFQEWQGEI